MTNSEPTRPTAEQLRDLRIALWLRPERYSDLLQHTAQAISGTSDFPKHPEDAAITFEMANDAVQAVIAWYCKEWDTAGVHTYSGMFSK